MRPTVYDRLRGGEDLDVDLPLSDGWRLMFFGVYQRGFYQFYRHEDVLMSDTASFSEAVDIVLYNAADDLDPARAFPFIRTTHEVFCRMQLGAWELCVADAQHCTPRTAEEMTQVALADKTLDDHHLMWDCKRLGYVDWYVRHRDGFYVSGTSDEDANLVLERVVAEIGAYEDGG
ncbi:MAG: hypothetical protein AAF125_10130 [Chloroflexota bacterium]